jgi:hypothetical protein
LYGKAYDAARTSALGLPSNVNGGAFRGTDGTYVYVLWAKTNVDLSENASATYSFPSIVAMNGSVVRKDWNFSQTNASSTIPKTNISLSGSPSFFIEATTVPTPPTTSGATKIEGENWTSMSGVQTENTTDVGGGKSVGWIENGDWMQYSVTTPSAGSYTLNFRLATIYSGAQFQVKNSSGQVLATVNVPTTGGFQTWQTVSATVNLAAGTQTLRLQSSAQAGWNINWLELAGGKTADPSPTPDAQTSTRIEAEAYTSMSGVQTENTSDVGGGKNVGWIEKGDWMEYSINTPSAGTYTMSLRLATIYNGSQLQVMKSDGSVLTTVNVPTTGGFQTWQTVTATLTLSGGIQTIRILSSSSLGWNINWFEIAGASATTPSSPVSSTKIEAENWKAMKGVQAETTTDAGGGKNVGYIENGDWMEYVYNAPSTGTYTINFRLASPNKGAQFQIQNSGGQILTTVNVPNTGGFQTWQTISATVNLPSGQQTLRLQSVAQAGWNINWMEIASGSTAMLSMQKSTLSTVDSTASDVPALEVYPNPVTDRFVLQVNNSLTGAVSVQIVNLQGAVQKQFSLSKTAAATSQFYLSIGELPAASYILKVSMSDWNDATQLIKQ